MDDLIALFDMDGTLFNYDLGLKTELDKIRCPDEPEIKFDFNNNPPYLANRIKLITSSESWWENLPKFELGWDILNLARMLDYKIHILTQGPKENPAAWSGKKKCIDKYFGEDFDVTLTRNKGLVYGKVLVDDYPVYIQKWLEYRKRGLVIMPAHEFNKDYKHPQVIRYDGKNLDEVNDALVKIKKKTLDL
jgi:FMN phosphatase YigB (HAD superfamily)